MTSASSRGMTLIEALVTMALASVVFGLILNTLIGTQRESDRLFGTEQMNQEALLISQNVERILRYRLAPEALEGVVAGGAGPDSAVPGGGAATTSTLPASIAAISSNTLEISTTASRAAAKPTAAQTSAPQPTPEPPADRLPASQQVEFTSAPATIQNILGTTSTMSAPPATPQLSSSPAQPTSSVVQVTQPSPSSQPAPNAASAQPASGTADSAQQPQASTQNQISAGPRARTASPQERFASDEVVVYSLGSGPDPLKLLMAIRNSRGLGDVPSHAFVEQRAIGSSFSPGERTRALGPNPDKFQSQVSFRFANTFNSTNAVWTRNTDRVPRLVEYTVRVWPKGISDPFDSQQDSAHVPKFQVTSAVEIP